MTSSQNQNPDLQANSAELKAEQALGLVSLGLMQKLTNKGISNFNWLEEDNESNADLNTLRQRLELTALAIDTGAPLSTSEVSKLLGVKPVSSRTERGGLVAHRLSRNVWKLNRVEKKESNPY